MASIFYLGLQFAEHLPPYVRQELEQLLAAVQTQAQNVLPVDSIPVTSITINELAGLLDYSQLPALAASKLLGRRSGSAGDTEPVTLGAGLSMSAGAVLSATAGDAFDWSVLTNGDVTNPELIFAGGDVIMLKIPA